MIDAEGGGGAGGVGGGGKGLCGSPVEVVSE